jgi:hypothetical protein
VECLELVVAHGRLDDQRDVIFGFDPLLPRIDPLGQQVALRRRDEPGLLDAPVHARQ